MGLFVGKSTERVDPVTYTLPALIAAAQARRARNCATTRGNAVANASTSSSVVDHPTDRRSERSESTPMAASTGDGARDSDEHDDPEWAAIPFWSRPRRTGSASTPPTATHTSCGTRLSWSPSTSAASTGGAGWTAQP